MQMPIKEQPPKELFSHEKSQQKATFLITHREILSETVNTFSWATRANLTIIEIWNAHKISILRITCMFDEIGKILAHHWIAR